MSLLTSLTTPRPSTCRRTSPPPTYRAPWPAVDRTCGPADAEALPPDPGGGNAVAADGAENVSIFDLPENLTAVDRTCNLTAVDPTENHLATDGAGNGDGDVPGQPLPENVQPAADTADNRPLDPPTTDRRPWDANDWDLPCDGLPARPRQRAAAVGHSRAPVETQLDAQGRHCIGSDSRQRDSTPRHQRSNHAHAAVTIGVVVTAQSLFGYSTMPGQLVDR